MQVESFPQRIFQITLGRAILCGDELNAILAEQAGRFAIAGYQDACDFSYGKAAALSPTHAVGPGLLEFSGDRCRRDCAARRPAYGLRHHRAELRGSCAMEIK